MRSRLILCSRSSHLSETFLCFRMHNIYVVFMFLILSQMINDSSAAAPDIVPPVVIYTDIVSGPNRGGENDKGIYLSIFGKNFGTTGLGTNLKVFIGGVEVDNYRYLGKSRGRVDIQQIDVQIGLLGNPTPGIPLPIKIVRDGIASNTNLTFVVNPGAIFFVSQSGSDTTAIPGSVKSPYRTIQTERINNNGKLGCPASAGMQPVEIAGVWGQVQAGDFIVIREGIWANISKDSFFLRVQNKSGKPPTGNIGTGPITIMGYPGEHVFIDRTNSLGDNRIGGGISSADSARQALGCGAWVTIANLKIESGFNDGMINVQKGNANPVGSHWRVVNNEMTAISCQVNTKCKGGGVSGAGVGGYWVGNHVHDVHDKPDLLTSFENHGFYMEGIGTYEVAFNRIENIMGGNGIQTHSTSSAITNNANIHHNIIRNVGKHGINIGDGSEAGIRIFNNIVDGADVAGIRFNSTDILGAKVFNNTFLNTDRLGKRGSRAALMNDAKINPGSIEIRNNIFLPAGGQYIGGSVGFGSLTDNISHNVWFDGKGSIVGKSNVLSDPLFVSRSVGKEDYQLRPGSPAIDSGTSVVESLVMTDFGLSVRRPIGRGYDIGAFEAKQ